MSTENKPKVSYPHEVHEPHSIQELHAPIMREKAEPRDGFEPVPPILAPLFGGLIFWAGFFFASNFRDFDATALSEEPPPAVASGPAKEPSPIVKGEAVFKGNCASCHGNEGAGASCPPLAKSEWLTDRSPGVLVRILLHGMEGPLKVAGKDYNPPSGMKLDLTDAQIVNVAAYVRQAWDNQVKRPGEITLEYVKAVREREKARKTRWTADELQAIPDDHLDAPLGANVPAESKDKK